MRTIQINYDLRSPGRNYQPVYDYIKSLGTWAKPLESLWLVRTSQTVSAVRDGMRAKVDANDEVLILDVTGDSWATNFTDSSTTWMHSYMGTATVR